MLVVDATESRKEETTMAMTPEERTERARKAGRARWENRTPEQEREARIKKLQSEAESLGFELVPLACAPSN